MKEFDLIVVGGGLVGYTFAIDFALSKPQFNIAVIEAKETKYLDNDAALDNRIYAIAPDNISYLEKLGINILKLRHGSINKMSVFGDHDSNIILDKNITKNQFLAKTFEYKILQHELYKKIVDLANVTLIYDNIQSIEHHENVVVKGQKDTYWALLLVGADGANSLVRRLHEIETKLIDYNQSGVVANFSCEVPHNNIAYQWFKNNEVLAYLPIANNQISIVWSTGHPEELLNLNNELFAEKVSCTGNYQLGKLKLETTPVAFPLKMYLLNKIYSEKIVLIGDAAHTIHPLAGQGVNLGFRDAKNLSATLSKIEKYQLQEIGVLAKYSASRQFAVKEMQLICHGLHRMFGMDNKITQIIRNKGVNIVNKLPLMKRIFMTHAS